MDLTIYLPAFDFLIFNLQFKTYNLQFTIYNLEFQRKCLSVCPTVASLTWQLVCLPIMRGGRFSQWRFTEFPFQLLNLGPILALSIRVFQFPFACFFIIPWHSCLHLYILLCFSSERFADWKFTKNLFAFVNLEPGRLYMYMCLSNEYF